MEEEDYFAIISESKIQQGYLFEPEYTEEQLQRKDEEESAAAAADAARQRTRSNASGMILGVCILIVCQWRLNQSRCVAMNSTVHNPC